MSDNIISLAAHLDDGTKWSVEDALEEALRQVRAGEIAPTKVLVLLLDDRGDGYRRRFTQAGMRTSDIVALTAYIQHDALTGTGAFE